VIWCPSPIQIGWISPVYNSPSHPSTGWSVKVTQQPVDFLTHFGVHSEYNGCRAYAMYSIRPMVAYNTVHKCHLTYRAYWGYINPCKLQWMTVFLMDDQHHSCLHRTQPREQVPTQSSKIVSRCILGLRWWASSYGKKHTVVTRTQEELLRRDKVLVASRPIW